MTLLAPPPACPTFAETARNHSSRRRIRAPAGLRRGAAEVFLAATVLSLAGCGGGSDRSDQQALSAAAPSAAAPAALPSPSVPVASDPSNQALIQAVQTPVSPPVTGWSSWNTLEENVTYATITAQADGLARLNSLITVPTLRYRFINIDEGWWLNGLRDSAGNPVVNQAPGYTTQWPGGMPGIVQYINGKGLKAGIYVDAGQMGCGTYWNDQPGETSSASRYWMGSDPAHYDVDFAQYSNWGFEWVKVDFCGARTSNYSNPKVLFPGITPIVADYDPQTTYMAVSNAIQKAVAATGLPMVLAITEQGAPGTDPAAADYNKGPWTWGPGVGYQWRTSNDIYSPNTGAPDISTVLRNFKAAYHPEAQHTGYYNDPDLMVVGMGMTLKQDEIHAGLWAILGAPMILGNDLSRPLSPATTALMTNTDMLGIDQDPLGLQGIQVSAPNVEPEIWAKLLTGSGNRAVALFNNGSGPSDVTVSWSQLGLDPTQSATVRDVWSQTNVGTFANSYTARSVPAQTLVLLTISGGTDTPPAVYQNSTTCAACAAGLQSQTFSNIQATATGGFVRIVYTNSSTTTQHATMTTTTSTSNSTASNNIGNPTTVAFPPTGNIPGSVTVWVPFAAGSNSLAFSQATIAGMVESLPAIAGILTVAGPVSSSVAYEAESPVNTMYGKDGTGTPVVGMSCGGCSNGQNVQYIGTGIKNGVPVQTTLQFNNIKVPSKGAYDVTIAYVDGDPAPARLMWVAVNDGAANQVPPFPPSPDWDTPANLTVTLSLNAGLNTIAISNTTGWAPSIDGIVSIVPHAGN